jgi:tetratricopeptide (TPR) repeat protein
VKSEEAITSIREHLTRALEASDYASVQDELGVALGKLGQVDPPARQDIELVIWMDYSVLAEHYGDLNTAVEFNEKLAASAPDDATSLLALARLYGKQRNGESAADRLASCLDVAERYDNKIVLAILAARGHLPAESGARLRRLDEAITVYRNALSDASIAASPERHTAIWSSLGDLHRIKSDLLTGGARVSALEDAMGAYRHALGTRSADARTVDVQALLEKVGAIEALLK